MISVGKHGDRLITDVKSLLNPDLLGAFREGAEDAGKDPASTPVLVEHLVVVGGKAEAEEAARCWRFMPNAWTEYVAVPDPREIERRAERDLPLDQVYGDWVVSEDPEEHIEGVRKLPEAGATQVYVHSGQYDQRRFIEFYGREVLPKLRAADA